jgi:hypothetical protein
MDENVPVPSPHGSLLLPDWLTAADGRMDGWMDGWMLAMLATYTAT